MPNAKAKELVRAKTGTTLLTLIGHSRDTSNNVVPPHPKTMGRYEYFIYNCVYHSLVQLQEQMVSHRNPGNNFH